MEPRQKHQVNHSFPELQRHAEQLKLNVRDAEEDSGIIKYLVAQPAGCGNTGLLKATRPSGHMAEPLTTYHLPLTVDSSKK